MNQRWLPVPGYEGLYEVSDHGYVRGLKKDRRILSMHMKPCGHLNVSLTKNYYRRAFLVHRLVLLAFVGPPPKGYEGRHYPDRNPTNNRLKNLSWASRETNQRDRKEHGTSSSIAARNKCYL